MTVQDIFDFALRLTPKPLRPLLVALGPDFLRFGFVGAAGFFVDLCGLTLIVRFAGWSAFQAHLFGAALTLTPQMQARFVSFPIAVAATWALNRNWTFKSDTERALHREVSSYVAVQLFGGVANLGAYNLMLILVPFSQSLLILPLAFGSAIGLCLTYVGSKYWAFRTPD